MQVASSKIWIRSCYPSPESAVAIGDRVAVAQPGCFRSRVRVPLHRIEKLLDSTSFAMACQIVPEIVKSYHAVMKMVHCSAGHRVLIMDGASLAGQAAIQLLASIGTADIWSECDSTQAFCTASNTANDNNSIPKVPVEGSISTFRPGPELVSSAQLMFAVSILDISTRSLGGQPPWVSGEQDSKCLFAFSTYGRKGYGDGQFQAVGCGEVSRSGPRTTEAKELLTELPSQGADVVTLLCDISDEAALVACLADMSGRMPPVKGCIQSNMTRTERIFERMESRDWNATLGPKVDFAGRVERVATAHSLAKAVELVSQALVHRVGAILDAPEDGLDVLKHRLWILMGSILFRPLMCETGWEGCLGLICPFSRSSEVLRGQMSARPLRELSESGSLVEQSPNA
ncbi:hypothetical protein O1611_g5437 [Lasiodiplodia mahajangana]|uniref:Uncharacterized protein n=1 Tax=Lasiodiplodia mahajangana TaxID=1108764 RepID=A0ACC2JLG4_9PEZI|nr:hypothetical protein O1611_g5437 [Lasiodiplodia mahajangana]